MIKAIEDNLQRGIKLLNSISNDQYSDTSVAPYFSSIGCHMRHILDVFSCIFKGIDNQFVDLSVRERNKDIEFETQLGIEYFNNIICQLKKVNDFDLDKKIIVSDDLGKGIESVNYTLAAILMQAHSHAIHHFASVGYIIYQLGIELPDVDFGFNPTTPKLKV